MKIYKKVRQEVEHAISECIAETWLTIPDKKTRSELITDCTEQIISSMENFEYCNRQYNPDYIEIVLDTAKYHDCEVK